MKLYFQSRLFLKRQKKRLLKTDAENEKLPIAKATCSQHLSELKEAGLIKGEIDGLRTRYCIDQDNWRECKLLFEEFIAKCPCNRKRQPDDCECKCGCD